jgi:hypothetical protein
MPTCKVHDRDNQLATTAYIRTTSCTSSRGALAVIGISAPCVRNATTGFTETQYVGTSLELSSMGQGGWRDTNCYFQLQKREDVGAECNNHGRVDDCGSAMKVSVGQVILVRVCWSADLADAHQFALSDCCCARAADCRFRYIVQGELPERLRCCATRQRYGVDRWVYRVRLCGDPWD